MKIEIHKPLSLNEQGKRANNEDTIYPSEATPENNLFIVCDGMGGAEQGEVASFIVCKSFAEYFADKKITISTQKVINDALEETQVVMDEYLEKTPEARGMGTTLTLLHLHEHGATLAHCGDSRIYHVRNEEILFCTEDHSVVNQLLKQGIITPEEAAESNNNRITRAIQGNSVRKTKADVEQITDIRAGDYFLLCSDGVNESISDEEIPQILSTDQTDAEKLADIKNLCDANSRDNFSLYLVHIKSVEKEKEILPTPKIANEPMSKKTPKKTPEKVVAKKQENTKKAETKPKAKYQIGGAKKHIDKRMLIALISAAVIVVLLAIKFYPSGEKKDVTGVTEKNVAENKPDSLNKKVDKQEKPTQKTPVSKEIQTLIDSMVFEKGGELKTRADQLGKTDSIGSFQVSKTLINKEIWNELMNNNPADSSFLENVSIEDKQRFIDSLNTKTGKKFRLPTKAELEYLTALDKSNTNIPPNKDGSVSDSTKKTGFRICLDEKK